MTSLEIKEKRKKLKLTQLELAKMLGVSLKTISNYENGGPIPEQAMNLLRIVLKIDEFYSTDEEKRVQEDVIFTGENFYPSPLWDKLSKKVDLIHLLDETKKQIELYSKSISLLQKSCANIQQQIEMIEIIEYQDGIIKGYENK